MKALGYVLAAVIGFVTAFVYGYVMDFFRPYSGRK
jgi:hypothetical protein